MKCDLHPWSASILDSNCVGEARAIGLNSRIREVRRQFLSNLLKVV